LIANVREAPHSDGRERTLAKQPHGQWPKTLMREKQARPYSGLGRTQWRKDRVLHDPADPFVPGTTIPRLIPIPLGPRAVGYDGDEVDAQNRAVIAHSRSALAEPVNSVEHDAEPAPPPSVTENSAAQEPESRRRRRRRLPRREVNTDA
jgi:hypothetical protein